MTLLLHPRPQAGSSSLLAGMLESPLEFGPPLHRSAVVATRGAREVIMGPRSPPRRSITVNGTPSRLPNGHLGEANGKVASNATSDSIEPSSSRLPVGTPTSTPTRKGKEPATTAHLPDVDLSWPTRIAQTQRSGAGLYNPSMACYANATLQVMLHTPPVLARAMSHKAEDCAQSKKGYCMLCAVAALTRKHWSHKHYSPSEVHNNLPKIRKGFSKHRQEDTHEFFRFVTDGLQASALAHLPKNIPEKVKQDTWVYQTWGGQVRSRVVCSKCQKPSDTFDSFLDLSLDVNKGSRPKLLSMLQGFVKEDRLEGENKYNCENCKSKANAIKFFRIAKAPPVLTLHLKRFNINYEYGRARAQKFNQLIDYPELIDIAPFMIDGNQSGTKYRLFGVTCHRGSELRFGHYTSYIRGPDGRWTHADDEDMTSVSAQTALGDKTAYVLSYIRVDDGEFAAASKGVAGESQKRKREDESTSDRPFKRESAPSSVEQLSTRWGSELPRDAADKSPSSPPLVEPTGSPRQPQYGFKPKTIDQSSFYGSKGGDRDRSARSLKKELKKAKRLKLVKAAGAPMPFAQGQKQGKRGKGMIKKMQRR